MIDLQKELDALKKAEPWYGAALQTLQVGERFIPARGATQSLPAAISHAINLSAGGEYATVYRVSGGPVEYLVEAIQIVGVSQGTLNFAAQQVVAKRRYASVHVNEDCRELSGTHKDEKFFNCVFDKLNGLSLIGCDLNQSKFKTASIKDALGFSVTLDCHTFKGAELSPLLMQLLLVLLTLTQGNDRTRKQLVEVVGKDRYNAMRKVLAVTEAEATQ